MTIFYGNDETDNNDDDEAVSRRYDAIPMRTNCRMRMVFFVVFVFLIRTGTGCSSSSSLGFSSLSRSSEKLPAQGKAFSATCETTRRARIQF